MDIYKCPFLILKKKFVKMIYFVSFLKNGKNVPISILSIFLFVLIDVLFFTRFVLFCPILSYPFSRILKNLIHGPFLFLSRSYWFLYRSYFLIQVLFFWHIFQKILIFSDFFRFFPNFFKFFLCSRVFFSIIFETECAKEL